MHSNSDQLPALPRPMISRRGLLAGSGAALSIGVVGPSRAAGGSFVSTVFGGAYESAYRKAIVDPFQKQTGTDVVLKLGMTSEWLTNAMVNRRRPEIDLLLLPYPDNIKAVAENLVIPLSASDIPNMRDLDPVWTEQFHGMGVGLDYVGYGIAYRTDLTPKAPTRWKDLWDPALKGKVTIPDIGSWGSWEMQVVAARLNGGSEDNMAPAFPMLHELKPNVRQFFRSGVDITQSLGSGDAWVCGMTTNIAAYALIDAGKPVKFVFPSDGAMAGLASYHIPKNSQNTRLCCEFIDFALSPDVQAAFCAGVTARPVNNKAAVTDRIKERVPPVDQLKLFDWFKILPQMSALTDQWNQQVAF